MIKEILRGDAREAVIWAVETFKPDLLVMGNRGLSPFSRSHLLKYVTFCLLVANFLTFLDFRMFMGSVSSYCCHNAVSLSW